MRIYLTIEADSLQDLIEIEKIKGIKIESITTDPVKEKEYIPYPSFPTIPTYPSYPTTPVYPSPDTDPVTPSRTAPNWPDRIIWTCEVPRNG